MGEQAPIKAILKQDVDYQDMLGNKKVVKRGEIIDLYVIKSGAATTDISGRTTIQNESSFLAVKGTDSFDIVAEEFKTID